MMGINHQSKMSLAQFGLILTFFFSAFFFTPRSFASVNNDPLSVLQSFIEAQAKGDAPVMMQELGLESLNSQEIENLKKMTTKFASFMKFANLELQPVALGISQQGNLAIIRFLTSLTITIKNELSGIHQTTGNIAIMRRINNIWKVHTIVPDELLTMENFQKTNLADKKVSPLIKLHATKTFASTKELVDLKTLNDKINSTINEWQIDEAKVSKDLVFSTFGKVPIMGDAVSNGYTIYERLKTIFIELPEDFNAGNLEATCLDIGLIAWGPVQIVTEFIPTLDVLADFAEGSIETYRYNAIQRFNYLQIQIAIKNMDFSELKKYLVLRFTLKNIVTRDPKHLDGEKYSTWHNQSLALQKLVFLSDLFLRTDPSVYFDIASEFPIKKKDNETFFNLAIKMGAAVDTGSNTTDEDDVAYIPIKLTSLANSSLSRGDLILKDFKLSSTHNYPTYQLTATRGQQIIQIKLSDGSETEPLLINNLVFNAIVDIQVNTTDANNVDRIELKNGSVTSSINLIPVIAQQVKNKIIPPEINGLPELFTTVLHPSIIKLEQTNLWPNASLKIIPQTSGSSRIDFFLKAGEGVNAVSKGVEIAVLETDRPKFSWRLKEISRKGMYAERLPESLGENLIPAASDLSVATTVDRTYIERQNGRDVQVKYQTHTFGSWEIPTQIVPGSAVSINISAGHTTEKFPYQTTLIATFPSWDQENSGGSFPTLDLRKVLKVLSGESASETIKLYAPSVENGATEGRYARFSIELYESTPNATTLTPKSNLRAARTFTYVLVKIGPP